MICLKSQWMSPKGAAATEASSFQLQRGHHRLEGVRFLQHPWAAISAQKHTMTPLRANSNGFING